MYIKKKDHLDLERPQQRNQPNNYRPITCLPVIWKILTAQIREDIYNSLISHRLFSEEEKGCHEGTSGKQLYIDQFILKEIKTRRKM